MLNVELSRSIQKINDHDLAAFGVYYFQIGKMWIESQTNSTQSY